MISYFGQDLSVVDKTPEEISELIHGLLSKQGRLKEPIIMVSPRPRGKEIFVGGAVKLPGRYPLLLQDEIGLYRAITIAGGFLEESADRKHIQVVGQDGTVEEHDLSPGKPYELITVGHGDLVLVLSLGVVDVQGEVKQPGQLRIRGRIRIDEALARAGGYTEEANLSELVIMRANGKNIVVPISEQFWQRKADYYLKDGDTLYVPNANRMEPISVLGYVRNPGEHKVRGPIAPLKAIALAGGREKGANLEKVKITRKDGTVQEVNLNAPQEAEILLYPGDMLDIPKGRQINWSVVLSFITVTSALVSILTR
jgi:protein involved in polysaccharide export with SLBB domain